MVSPSYISIQLFEWYCGSEYYGLLAFLYKDVNVTTDGDIFVGMTDRQLALARLLLLLAVVVVVVVAGGRRGGFQQNIEARFAVL